MDTALIGALSFTEKTHLLALLMSISNIQAENILVGKAQIKDAGGYGFLALNFKKEKLYNVGVHIDFPPDDKIDYTNIKK